MTEVPTSGSLCSGYGGLDLAVEAVFGARTAWVSEIDEPASRVLGARFPGVPNLGDLRSIDPPAVDILTGGFPCQPVSLAGRRAGTNDERWLFDDICELLGRMGTRPRLCVFENVPGLLSANGGDAMARVVRGLAQVGYVGSWRVVAASDVGACHRRERVFIAAIDADSSSARRWQDPRGLSGDEGADEGRATERDHVTPGAGADAAPLSEGTERRGPKQSDMDAACGPASEPRKCASATSDSEGGWGDERRSGHSGGEGGAQRVPVDDRGGGGSDFGAFSGAVRRWECVIGRCAPVPAIDRRLNPRFVEWMMGLPDGWVCDVLTRRTQSLKVLGNGVVPQQAAYAIRGLL